jgi:hypothetical protein
VCAVGSAEFPAIYAAFILAFESSLHAAKCPTLITTFRATKCNAFGTTQFATIVKSFDAAVQFAIKTALV